MPTGYTYPVCEGKVTDFAEFAMQCARAFGACITMRDDPVKLTAGKKAPAGCPHQRAT